MNRFICVIVFTLSLFSMHAQSTTQQEEIKSLTQKVDSLEHRLSYLNLAFELYTLNSDINMFTNEVYIKSLDIQLNINNRNFQSKLCNLYQSCYESYLPKMHALHDLIEVKTECFSTNITTYPYSETELSLIKSYYKIINKSYDLLEEYMRLLKFDIDAYKDFCNSF